MDFLNFAFHMEDSKNTGGRQRRRQAAPIDTSYGHLQPQAPDIEKVVLGALMIDKDAFTVVSEIVRPETFYEPRHQKIFHAIRSLNIQEQLSLIHISEPTRPY